MVIYWTSWSSWCCSDDWKLCSQWSWWPRCRMGGSRQQVPAQNSSKLFKSPLGNMNISGIKSNSNPATSVTSSESCLLFMPSAQTHVDLFTQCVSVTDKVNSCSFVCIHLGVRITMGQSGSQQTRIIRRSGQPVSNVFDSSRNWSNMLTLPHSLLGFSWTSRTSSQVKSLQLWKAKCSSLMQF